MRALQSGDPATASLRLAEPARSQPAPVHDDAVSRARETIAGEPCPLCGKRGAWSSLQPDAIYTPPPGHTVHRLAGEFRGIKVDSCSLEFFIPPDFGTMDL
jgi:hypothetical protein